MADIQMFPQVFISLQEELLLHPDLQQLMLGCPETDFPTRLGYLAGLLDVLVDGYYHYGEIEVLADILIRRMQERRRSIIVTTPNKQLLIAGTDAVEAVEETKMKGDTDGSIIIQ
jgi:hypothetical protein